MSNQLFQDNLKARTKLGYEKAMNSEGRMAPKPHTPPVGVDVILTCSECGRELDVQFPWSEVSTLLGGGQVLGMVPDGRGWQGKVRCPGFGGMACISMGGPTELTYRVSVDDFRRHVDNLQAGSRPVGPQPQQQMPQQQPQQPMPQPPPPPQPPPQPRGPSLQQLQQLLAQAQQNVAILYQQIAAQPQNPVLRQQYAQAQGQVAQIQAQIQAMQAAQAQMPGMPQGGPYGNQGSGGGYY